MEGNSSPGLRGSRFTAALALTVVAFAGRASAQQPPPPFPPSGVPARSFAGLVEVVSPQQPAARPVAFSPPASSPESCGAPTGCRAELSLADTIKESLCGDASAEGRWR